MTEERAEYNAGDLSEVRSCEVTLGTTRYTVQEASYLRGRRFWPLLSEQLTPIGDALKEAGGLSPDSNLGDFGSLLPVAQRVLLEAPEALLDAICAYDAGIEAARAQIEESATDRQIIAALLAMMEMSDPFGMRKLVRRGLSRLAPSSKLPPASGE